MPFPLFAAVPGSEQRARRRGHPGQRVVRRSARRGRRDARLGARWDRSEEQGEVPRARCEGRVPGRRVVEVADVFFHGTVNYEQGLGVDYLKLTSCNTTGLIRSVDAIHRAVGVTKTFITIVRRVADPGDTHRGLTNVLQVEPVPNHQAVDLMHIMPEIDATGMLIHTPVTHGHIITLSVTPKEKMSVDAAIEAFRAYPRIMVVRIDEGFNSNSSLFQWADTWSTREPTCTRSACGRRWWGCRATTSSSRSTSRRSR
jgi:hypothetical protein